MNDIPKGFQVAARRARSRAAECTVQSLSSETSAQQSRGLKGEGYMGLTSEAKRLSFAIILLLLVCFALFQRAPLFASQHLAWQLQTSLIGVSFTPLLIELSLLSAAGLVVDLFGARLILLLSSLFFIFYDICLMLNVSILLTHDLFIFMNAFVLIAALKFFYDNFSKVYFAVSTGLAFSIVTGIHLNASLIWLNWSRMLAIAGISGAILMVLMFVCFYVIYKPVRSRVISLADVLDVIKRPQVWLLCMVALGGALSVALFSLSWGDQLLQQYYGLSLSQTNQALAFLLVGWLCGTVLFAYLASKTAHAKYWIVATYIVAIVLFLLLSNQPTLPYVTLVFILASFGFLIASSVMSYIMLTQFSVKSSFGFAVSLLIFVSTMTILFIKAMMSFKLPTDLLATGTVVANASQSWKTIFWYVPMFLGIGAVCAIFIRRPLESLEASPVTFWQELPIYWRGEKSLAMSFWLLYAFSASVLSGFVYAVDMLFLANSNWFQAIVSSLYVLFCLVCVWRSAVKHPSGMATLAQIWMVIALVYTAIASIY